MIGDMVKPLSDLPVIEVRVMPDNTHRVRVVNAGGTGVIAWQRKAANMREIRVYLLLAAKVRDRQIAQALTVKGPKVPKAVKWSKGTKS